MVGVSAAVGAARPEAVPRRHRRRAHGLVAGRQVLS